VLAFFIIGTSGGAECGGRWAVEQEDQLALDLKVSPHVLRKTLRALEGEQFLRREHRKFKVRKRDMQLRMSAPSV
jgi:hypothetical protein